MTYEHPEAPNPEQLSAAAAEAKARIIEDIEEWEIADEEGGDGGPAVKLLPAAEMAQARAFQQGLNRAVKAEEKLNRIHARSNARNRQRGDCRGGKGTNEYSKDYPALKPSIERKGKIKYHAANEKTMRGNAAQVSDEDGWGWIGEDDGKAQNDNARNHDAETTDQYANTTDQKSHSRRDPNFIPPHLRVVQNLQKPKKNVKDDAEEDLIILEDKPKKIPLPPQRLMARMKLLDAYDDNADGGVPLI